MIILFVIGLLVGALSVIFAFQNIAIVTVHFFSFELTGSLALVILFAISLGVLTTVLLLLPEFIASYFKYKSLKKENKLLEEDLRKQKELTLFAKKTPPTADEIAKIEDGVSEDPTHA